MVAPVASELRGAQRQRIAQPFTSRGSPAPSPSSLCATIGTPSAVLSGPIMNEVQASVEGANAAKSTNFIADAIIVIEFAQGQVVRA